MRRIGFGLCSFVLVSLMHAAPAAAAPIVVMVGDNDGFGFGAAAVPDGAPLLNINLPEDRRSAAEAAATNGAQQTDFYSALFTPLPFQFDVILPFAGVLTSGTLTIDMGGFQAATFGQITASLNGIAQPNLLNFEDGAFATAVRTFGLSPAVLAAANLAGQLVLRLDRSGSNDAIAFDFFRLNGEVDAAPIPEPATLLLFGSGIAAGVARRRRQRARN